MGCCLEMADIPGAEELLDPIPDPDPDPAPGFTAVPFDEAEADVDDAEDADIALWISS